MVFSTSFLAFSTISSILAGCILPSRISFSRVSLATSLFIGSNPDNITASGVSSIIRSIPVNVSKVLIFLPSLPIILPFISSFGNGTTETVTSETWSAAHFWMAIATISFAFASASSFALTSMSLTSIAISCLTSLSTFLKRTSLASSTESPEIFSSSSICLCWCSRVFSSSSWISLFFLFKTSSFCSIVSIFLSKVSSFWTSRLSCLWRSFLLSFISLSSSTLLLWTSSLASSNTSLFLASATFSASLTSLFASSSALPISASAFFFLNSIPSLKLIPEAIIEAITAITIPIPNPIKSSVIAHTSLFSFQWSNSYV